MYSKKPSLKRFQKAAEACNGIMSRMAVALGCDRRTIKSWCNADEEFAKILEDYRYRLFDECLQTGRAVALGIPEVDPVTKKIVGWKVAPDPNMLRYFITNIGRDEGFGDSVDITTGGKPIDLGIQVEVIDRREQVERKADEDI